MPDTSRANVDTGENDLIESFAGDMTATTNVIEPEAQDRFAAYEYNTNFIDNSDNNNDNSGNSNGNGTTAAAAADSTSATAPAAVAVVVDGADA